MNCRTVKLKTSPDDALTGILELLPVKYREAYDRLSVFYKSGLSEIRIRADCPCSFTCGTRNIIVKDSEGKTVCSDTAEIYDIIANACGGSVYSVQECINDGYIPLGGARIGVCGTGNVIDGRYSGQRNITSLVFRIPTFSVNAADRFCDHIARYGFENTMGVLAVSPPNCGKTTFLRALAAKLSDSGKYAKRVCIIDEREELYNKSMMEDCLCDVIKGMPKMRALEMAIRTLSPQVIVFDEIGSEEQTELLCRAFSGGVYVAASVHGSTLADVMHSRGIRDSFKKGVFSTVYLMNDNTAYGDGEIINVGNGELA